MRQVKADLVVCFDLQHKADVQAWLNNHPTPHLINLIEENDEVLLIFYESTFNKLSDWLDKTVSLVNYEQHQEFFNKRSDASILHLYLPFNNPDDTVDLSFSARHAITLEQLSTIIDVDYYPYWGANNQQ